MNLLSAVKEASGKIFPSFSYNVDLTELEFGHDGLKQKESNFIVYYSSNADLEERLSLSNTDGRQIFGFKSDGKFYAGEETTKAAFAEVCEAIALPFEQHLKQNPQLLVDFTKRRKHEFYESDTFYMPKLQQSMCYPELLGKNISVCYTYFNSSALFYVERRDETNRSEPTKNESYIIHLNKELLRQRLPVVRGAVCLGLSAIAAMINNPRNVKQEQRQSMALLQIDAYRRGFPKEMMAYAVFAEQYDTSFDGLKSSDIIAIVRESQAILTNNLHNPRYILK